MPGGGDDLTEISGIGDSLAETLEDAGITTRDDLHLAFKRDADVISQIPPFWQEEVAEAVGVDASTGAPTGGGGGGGDDSALDEFAGSVMEEADLGDDLGIEEEVREEVEDRIESALEHVDFPSGDGQGQPDAEPEPTPPPQPSESLSDPAGDVLDIVGDPIEANLITTTGCPSCATVKDELSDMVDDGTLRVLNIQEDGEAADIAMEEGIKQAPTLVVDGSDGRAIVQG